MAQPKVDTSDKPSIVAKKTFCCTRCTYSTDYHHNLRLHAKNIHNKILSKFQCCNIRFIDKETFKMHLAEFHIQKYKCELCHLGFYNKGELNMHVNSCGKIAKVDRSKSLEEKKTFCCTLCTYSTDYHSRFRQHSTKIHNKYICKFQCCDIRFSDEEAFEMHLAEFHIPRYNCDLCHVGFYNETELNRHVKCCGKNTEVDTNVSLVEKKTFSCTLCTFSTDYHHNLRLHAKSVHDKRLSKFQCCDIRFLDNKAFEMHLAEFHIQKYKCELCHLGFYNKGELNMHVTSCGKIAKVDRSKSLEEKKTFCCTLCTYSTDYHSRFRQHSTKIHNKYICKFQCCDIRFSDEEAFEMHLAEFHIPRYNCDLCHVGFYNGTELNRHAKCCGKNTEVDTNVSLVEKKTFSCTLCTFSTDYHHNLRLHAKSVHDKRLSKFQCCDIRFLDNKAFKMHLTEFHIPRYKCDLCHRAFYTRSKLNMHVNTCGKNAKVDTSDSVVERKTFCCTLCTYSSDYQKNLRLHAKKIHKKYIRKFECCDILFLDKEAFQMHLAEFHIPRYKCELCHLGFYNKGELHMHVNSCGKITSKVDTSLVENKTFSCSLCNFSTDYYNNLRFHVKGIHNKILSKLECCDIRFLDKEAFKMHLAEFHIPRYNCELCHSAYYNKADHSAHAKSCGKTKKMSCIYCDFTTNIKATLLKHKQENHQIASKAEWLKCQKCPYETKWLHCFRRHARRHEVSSTLVEKKTFSCTLCTYSSDYRSNVRVHTKKMHNKILSKLECCDIRFLDDEALKMHLAEFHIPRYKCDLCHCAYYTKAHHSAHAKSCGKTKKLSCIYCDFTTNIKATLLKHKQENHQIALKAKSFECQICPFKTKWLHCFRRHARRHEVSSTVSNNRLFSELKKKKSSSLLKMSLKKKLFECENGKCSFKTKWAGSLRRHLMLHEVPSTSLCSNGKKHVRNLHKAKPSLEDHIDSSDECEILSQKGVAVDASPVRLTRSSRSQQAGFTEEIENKTFSCSLCTYSSDYRSNLRLHARNVHKKNPSTFECCDICFSDKEALKKHTADFHIPRYKCELCDFGFYAEANLNRHVKFCVGKINKMSCNFTTIKKEKLPNQKHDVRNLHKAKPSLEDHIDSSDECEVLPQKQIVVDASPVRLTRSSRSQQADIEAELTDEDKLTAKGKKQNSRKRKYGDYNNGEESLDISEKCNMKKNRAIRDFVEEGLNLRLEYRNRSLSLGERHSTALASRKNSDFQMLSAVASNGLLMLDSDEEANQSSSQESLVMNKTEPLQADLKEKLFCPICPHNTNHPGNLKKHVKIMHGELSKYKCSTCPQKFDNPYVLKTHQMTHQIASCNFCKFTTYNEVNLKQHMKWKHNFEYSLAIPFEESNLDNSTGQLVNLQPVVVLNRMVVNLPLKQTENEIIKLKETNENDHDRSISESDHLDRDGAISESDHSLSSNSSVRLPSRTRSGQLAIEKTPPFMNESYFQTPGSKLVINSIHDEARQLRVQISQTMAISDVLPLLQRLLEMSCSLTNLIRETTEVESRFQTIETFEYVWHTSKTAVARWEELKGLMNHDTSLNAITYAYTTLPLFNNWEKSEHLEMLGNVILLISNTVKNLQLKPWNQSESRFSETNFSFERTVNNECQSSVLCAGPSSAYQVKKENVASVVGTMKKTNVSSVNPPKKTNLASLKEFCRLANKSIGQNTKCRSKRGFKDDDGDYHAMYRVGIGKMLSHFCPADVTHLNCCGTVFDFHELKKHVNEHHEAGRPYRTEPSISPA